VGELVRRLRGEYRIPITDGLGPAGGDEPDNAKEFVMHYPSTPIQREAADALTSLVARLAECEEELSDCQKRKTKQYVQMDAICEAAAARHSPEQGEPPACQTITAPSRAI
jgi:hypothetical protein